MNDYYSYHPTGGNDGDPRNAWVGLVRYFGALSTHPDWRQLSGLFDLIKQVSTSCIAADYTPSLDGESVRLARSSPTEGARQLPGVLIEAMPNGQFQFTALGGSDSETMRVSCDRERALNVLMWLIYRRDADKR